MHYREAFTPVSVKELFSVHLNSDIIWLQTATVHTGALQSGRQAKTGEGGERNLLGKCYRPPTDILLNVLRSLRESTSHLLFFGESKP